MTEADFEHEQEDEAAAEAAAIGGSPTSEPPPSYADPVDPAQAPLIEAGEGESEGFEMAEQELIEHASHGDDHAAWRIHEDAPMEAEESPGAAAGEADEEHTAEGPDEDR